MKNKRLLGLVLGLSALLAVGGLFASNMSFKYNYPLVAQAAGVSQDGTQSLALPFLQKTGLVDAFDLIQDVNQQAVDFFCIEGANGGNPCVDAADCPGGCCTAVNKVVQFTPANNGLTTYNGCSGAVFPVGPGRLYQIQVLSDVEYIIVGSHDPGLVINLKAQGADSLDGTNIYSYPYHSVASTAGELIDEIDVAAGVFECERGRCSDNPSIICQADTDCASLDCEGLGDPCAVDSDCLAGCCRGVTTKVTQFLPPGNGLRSYDGCTGTAFALTNGQSYQVQVTRNTSFVPAHY